VAFKDGKFLRFLLWIIMFGYLKSEWLFLSQIPFFFRSSHFLRHFFIPVDEARAFGKEQKS
jgi:hypothetical protein